MALIRGNRRHGARQVRSQSDSRPPSSRRDRTIVAILGFTMLVLLAVGILSRDASAAPREAMAAEPRLETLSNRKLTNTDGTVYAVAAVAPAARAGGRAFH